MASKYWLFKSEPETFSIDHLAKAKGQSAPWDGVRSYRVRNMLRDEIKLRDQLFFYHSSTEQKGIAGIAEVIKEGYPDHTAWDPKSTYYDPKAPRENPRWFMVDIHLFEKFPVLVPLALLRETAGLEEMGVIQQGNRLSIQPVTEQEWGIVVALARQLAAK